MLLFYFQNIGHNKMYKHLIHFVNWASNSNTYRTSTRHTVELRLWCLNYMLNLLNYARQLHGNSYFNHSSSVIALFKSITVKWFKVTTYYRNCTSQRDWYKNSRDFIPECYSSPSKYPEMVFLSSRKLTKKMN